MPVSRWTLGSIARGLAQYPRQQQQIEQAARERREKFAYDILKTKYEYDRKAELARLTLQQPEMLAPDKVFKLKSKFEKLKLKYKDAEREGKRYGAGRLMQEIEANGINYGKLLSEAERGNEQAAALIDDIKAFKQTLPDELTDWMTIAEQKNIGDTKFEQARGLALATGLGQPKTPAPIGTRIVGGRFGFGGRGLGSYKIPVYPNEPADSLSRRKIEAYREYKGYSPLWSKKEGKVVVPDLSGAVQGQEATPPAEEKVYASEEEIQADIDAGIIKDGDIIIVNGEKKKVRLR